VHDRGLLAAHPQFLPNPAIHPESGAAAVAPVQKVRTDPLFPLRLKWDDWLSPASPSSPRN
jgi:hypothetical protein